MSFLKKLGIVAAQIGATVVGVGPIMAPLFGNKAQQIIGGAVGVADLLTTISGIVLQMEVALQGKQGAEKFAAAVALVGPVIRGSQLLSGKKIADAALLQKGIEEITQGVVDVLNSVHEESVKTEIATIKA